MRVELYGEKSLEENTGRIELYLVRVTWTASGQTSASNRIPFQWQLYQTVANAFSSSQ